VDRGFRQKPSARWAESLANLLNHSRFVMFQKKKPGGVTKPGFEEVAASRDTTRGGGMPRT
jgi:hypothetical protein